MDTPEIEVQPCNSPTKVEPHEETAEIVRQVEFYFSDENLPHDAHMLGLTGGDGNGPVSFGHIHAFRKMRQYKPRPRVIASLKHSTKLRVIKDKFIQRREPLRVPITVQPTINVEKSFRATELEAKPWLTKGMLRPTGFEEYATDGPIRPEEYAVERKLFDPDESFAIRIENAVIRYTSKRKMHQINLQILTKFLLFCGFEAGQRQFSGGLTARDLEAYEKDEIEQMKTGFGVSAMVLDGLEADTEGGPTWIVDFETTAKGFLSSSFMSHFDWCDAEMVWKATNLLTNFYNYLLYHDVCPEYKGQIFAARSVCDMAAKEFPILARADQNLPGNFSIACSALHGGAWAQLHRESSAEWDTDGDNMGLSRKDALLVFAAGVFANGSDEQVAQFEASATKGEQLQVVSSEPLGLEVVRVELASPQAKEIYEGENSPFKQTFVTPTGKLHCIRWTPPHAPPLDLSPAAIAELKAKKDEELVFVMEENVLPYCFPGLKMEATINELDLGVKWIDHVTVVYPSFFTWTMNEVIREWKEPGPPKAWMQRQMDKQDRDDAPETAHM